MNQWNYKRYYPGKLGSNINWPVLIVYAEKIAEADKQFKAITGESPSKLTCVGVDWFEVAHVAPPATQAPGALTP